MKIPLKRIAALAAAVLMILLAVSAFILAILGASFEVLAALLFCLVLIPVIAYGMILAARVISKNQDN